jgi:chromosome partitioning protein
MKKIGFLSQKGGSGKTTLCVHLGVIAQKTGESIIIVDCDPQGSAAAWGAMRKKPPTVIKATPSALQETLRRANATLVLIDTAPHSTPGMDIVASSVDLLLIPCRPSAFDLAAITSSVQIAKAAKCNAAFVLNGVNYRSAEFNEIRKALERHGLPIAPTALGQRTPFVRAISTGRAVSEVEPKGKAAEEIEQLWKWLGTRLK